MSEAIEAAAKAEIAKVGEQGRATAESLNRIGEKAVGNVEAAGHKVIAEAKAGNPSSIVMLIVVGVAVAGLVFGLVHTH